MLPVFVTLGAIGCASDGGDGPRPSQRRVTARVVDIGPTPPVTSAGTLNRKPLPSARVPPIEPEEGDAPREVPVVTTTSVERGGSQVVREEATVQQPDFNEAPRGGGADLPSADAEERFMLRIAWDRPQVPLDGTINGEPVVVGYIAGEEGCSHLGVTYPVRRVSEIWRVCADRQFLLERKAEPTPGIPDDPGLEAHRMFAVQSAYNEGRASVPFGPMVIGAQAGDPPDARGCRLIRSALSWQGIPVATRDETICRGPGE